ncbi:MULTISPECIES: nucleotidyltransferase domain-containing protein [Streptomyces]|uniref:nucleotidyltransferase domain-containing protein n=1 Tax=Streptomyces TaxID=1883 RepID=UPI00103A8E5A|nr:MULTISPECIES: hypothetical protein [Streptomyces]MBT3075047.1 hypothetical protein [Streptomyces sp. COG21]MBT3088994.1 hypothetical protein [Streptomyces sp. CYG21]MBT3097807.1 hypothetical protein [Streptomyces sp. CBG30]MBT3103875.1 hypothetical protein [Streptomyces sp. COG19]MBT3113281.1 hypothetical protein [Streptomyces sp. CYG20]
MSERRPPGGETGQPARADEQLPDGGTELSPREIEALDSRWASAWPPAEVARRLAGVRAPWCVAAGWALDLFRGGQTRAHGDIEIAVPAGRFPEVRRRFPGYVFDAAGSGQARPPEDQADFDATLPHLSSEQRASLERLLDRVHPGHAWSAGL